jgi:hypothetical protein
MAPSKRPSTTKPSRSTSAPTRKPATAKPSTEPVISTGKPSSKPIVPFSKPTYKPSFKVTTKPSSKPVISSAKPSLKPAPSAFECTNAILSQYTCCSYQAHITFASDVTTIPDGALNQCSSLISVIFPDTVTSIGNYSFTYTALTTLIIPDSVTLISHSGFLCDCHK